MTFVLAQPITRHFNCVLVRVTVRVTESESVLIFLYTELLWFIESRFFVATMT